MIIDNGIRRQLIITGVFEGTCGESRGVLSFIPNRTGKRPIDARGGLLDGEPVILAIVPGQGGFFDATYRRPQ